MALPRPATVLLAILGLLSFIFAKAIEYEMAYPVKDTCDYDSDLGSYLRPGLGIGSITLSISLLFTSALSSLTALYCYGRKVFPAILRRSTTRLVVTILFVLVFVCAEAFLMCATVLEFYHRDHNVQSSKLAKCQSANAWIFDTASYLPFKGIFFFCASFMLNLMLDQTTLVNEEDNKGSYGEVTTHPQPGIHSRARV